MNTPNNAAALERLEKKWRESAEFLDAHAKRHESFQQEVRNRAARDIYTDCADELATLRATLTQPDALTSQPSGGGVVALEYADPDDVFLSLGTDDVPCLQVPGRVLARFIPGSWDRAYELFSGSTPSHPSADAPGVAVDEDWVDVALTAYNRADYQWAKRDKDDRDEPRHRFAMRAAVAALDADTLTATSAGTTGDGVTVTTDELQALDRSASRCCRTTDVDLLASLHEKLISARRAREDK